MQNPLSDMIEKTKAGMQESAGMGGELKAKKEMMDNAKQALSSAPAPKPSPVQRKPEMWEKASGKAAPKGEKDMYKKASEWAQPMSYADGGEVKKTGVAMVHKGEHVLTPEHKGHIKAALSMAEGALSHEKEAEPDMPKKEVSEMRIRKGASGGHIIKHVHVHMHLHPDEEHVTHDTDGLVDHVMHHMTEPNEGEKEADAGDPGIEEMQHVVGYK